MSVQQDYILDDSEGEKEEVLKKTQNNEQDEDDYQNQCCKIPFARMEQQNKKQCKLVAGTPLTKYLSVRPGVNLRGKCSNQLCDGKYKSWYDLGYGTFNINKEVTKGKCRQCGAKISSKTVLTLGFRSAIVQIQGSLEDINGDQVQIKKTYEQRNGNLIYFQGNSDENLANWQYITVTCRKI